MRGYFEIGIYNTKTPANLGTLWRSAYQLGAAGIFTIGKRYTRQASDTIKAYRHVPLREFQNVGSFLSAQPYDCPIIAVEMGGRSLPTFSHPERAIYLLGAEDHGLTPDILRHCLHTIAIPAQRTDSFNVAVAGSLVMFDRQTKLTRAVA